jgi:hypothetical protein
MVESVGGTVHFAEQYSSQQKGVNILSEVVPYLAVHIAQQYISQQSMSKA